MKKYTEKEVNEWWDSLPEPAKKDFTDHYDEFTHEDKENCLRCLESMDYSSDPFREKVDASFRKRTNTMKELMLDYPERWTPRSLIEFGLEESLDPNIGWAFFHCLKTNDWVKAEWLVRTFYFKENLAARVLHWLSKFVDPEKLKKELMQINTDPKPKDSPETSQKAGSHNISHGGN